MSENPVIKWIPLFPSDEVEDKEKLVSEFVDKLMKEGVCEISIPGDDSKKLFITYREGKNPSYTQNVIDKNTFNKFSKFSYGFTSVFVLDLLEKTDDSTNKLKSVGHRDYRIAKFPEECIANGNFAAHRNILPVFAKPEYQMALNEADQSLGDSANGVELSQELWGKKLGKFLMALSIRILSKIGVTQIDLSGSISPELLPIVSKFGYSTYNRKLEMSKINQEKYTDFILPFIK